MAGVDEVGVGIDEVGRRCQGGPIGEATHASVSRVAPRAI